MTGFTIDDVRETFERDVRGLLQRIEIATKDLAALPLFASLEGSSVGVRTFGTVTDSAHAVAGSSGLISLQSLYSTARKLEELSGEAQTSFRKAHRALARARRIATLCSEGVRDLEVMLDHELAHESGEAEKVSAAFAARALALDAVEDDPSANSRGPESFRSQSSEGEFSFEEPASKRTRGITLELSAVFREEATGLVAELTGLLRDLSERPQDVELIAGTERVYHTLKGAAATVGLTEVSALAAKLQHDMESVVEGQRAIDRAFLDGLYADTDAFLRLAELPSIEKPEPPAPAPPREDQPSADAPLREELVSVFRKEVRDSLVSLTAHIEALSARPDNPPLLEHVERVYHTLKGAAATVGLVKMANLAGLVASDLEQVNQKNQAMTPQFFDKLVATTNHLLKSAGLPPVAPAPPAAEGSALPAPPRVESPSNEFSFADEPPDAGISEDLRGVFQQEARESLVALKGHLAALAADPSDLAVLGHIERIFHTLKGAAATVGMAQVSQLSADLQKRVEAALDTAQSDPALYVQIVEGTRRLVHGAGLGDMIGMFDDGMAASEGSDIAVARSYFIEEAKQICTAALRLAPQLDVEMPQRRTETRAELARLFHRLKGSAVVSTDRRVVDEASRLQRILEGTQAFDRESLVRSVDTILEGLGIRLGDSMASGGDSKARSDVEDEAPVRVAVTLPKDLQLWEAFNQECSELLESMDKAILELESSGHPKRTLETLMRLVHTLKGAINTVGLTPTGNELHLVEDFIEGLIAAKVLPPVRGVVTFLLRMQGSIRRALEQARSGFVETSLPKLERQIRAVFVGKAMDEAKARSGPTTAPSFGEGSSRAEDSGRAVAPDRKYIRVSTERLDALMNLAGELVVSRSRLTNRVGVLRTLQTDLSHSRRRLIDAVDRFREEHEFSLMSTAPRAGLAAAPRPDAMRAQPLFSSFSELELDRYDDFNMLSRALTEITDDVNETNGLLFRELGSFADDSDAFGAIVTGIQSEVTRARMVPLEFVFSRLRLPVRDAAEREKKDVRVVTKGEDVNLDKTIADALFSPMLHLVRNAVVHGIESAAKRGQGGKEQAGTVTLVAREESGQIVLEVRDDGGGLDLAALRQRGVEMGLVPASIETSDPRIRDLVFAPGLSTRATAGAVSGRGVGGDVVRRAIERLNGDIRVETTKGKGTTFVITLPLTLAITKALLLESGKRPYAVPLYFAERIIDHAEATVVRSGAGRRVKIDDAYVPLKHLDELLGGVSADDPKGPILIVRVGDQRSALQVDGVTHQEEIVVKGLGDVLEGHPLFAGVTIRGTGDLVLIVDVPAIVDMTAGRDVTKGSRDSRSDVEAVRLDTAPSDAKERGRAESRSGDSHASESRSLDSSREEAPPVREALAKPAPRTFLPVSAAALAEARARMRVLFVDDSLSVRKVAERALGSLGADVTVAVDGLDALAKLREQAFDIIFTDLEMPRMHGYDLIRELRFIPAYRDMPILVVSSRSAQKHQEQARALGASEYLTKPFTPQTLEAALKRWGKPPERK